MVFRSVVLGTFLVVGVMSEGVKAQVLLCPDSRSAIVNEVDLAAEAERLLQRLSIALDLHGHRGIDEAAILRNHAETPGALLAKLNNIANRCTSVAGSNIEAFQGHLPGLRKGFLEATAKPETIEVDAAASSIRVKPAAGSSTDSEQVELSIDLSVRELWRKLWFRRGGAGVEEDKRWAVIVASPETADSGWDALGAHQREWKDVYFQLHEPYYDDNPHHAVVVGRRLPREEAQRLLKYVRELGMADDAYLWPLPVDDVAVTPASASVAPAENPSEPARETLDLSILKD